MSLLYLKHFDLVKPPFQITPDTDFFFTGSQRGGILNALIHVACHEEGIATAVAEIGSGKTLLARLMISRLPESVSSVYLANPCFSRDEIISAIARDLGLADLPGSLEGKLALLHQELLRRHAQGQRVLLVIDEAHLMPIESIEEVRLLSNLETGQHKLINIMLFGQPELDDLLADRRLRQVRDRVIHRFELPAMTRDEAASYIDHRLRVAGWQGGRVFSMAATALLLKLSEGRARRINLLADKALLAAYAASARSVEKHHVKSAYVELRASSTSFAWIRKAWWRPLVAGTALSVPLAAAWTITTGQPKETGTSLQASMEFQGSAYDENPGRRRFSAPISQRATVSKTAFDGVHVKNSTYCPARINTASTVNRSYVSLADTILKNTEVLLETGKPRGLAVRLALLPDKDCLPGYLELIEKRVDPAQLHAHRQNLNGKDSVAVYFGAFPSEDEARSAMKVLSGRVVTITPIVRRWDRISQEVTS